MNPNIFSVNSTSSQLLENCGKEFSDLYLSGVSVERIKLIMNLSHHYAYKLKRLLNLHQERWQRLKMPEKFSTKIKSLIYGTVMGDASIHYSGGSKYNIFSICHSYKQLEYLSHKRDILLDELKLYPIKNLHDKWNTHRFVSPPHPEFDKIYNDFYWSGEKQISENVINALTPQAIAWWFMDDGGLLSNRYGFSIATCSFNNSSISKIREFLSQKYNIETNVLHNPYARLYFYSKNALKLKSLIIKYIIPSMEYKINLAEMVGRTRN